MPSPAVTLVIAAFNAESTLPAAIESILRQAGADFELIIVDDGSTDATLHIAERYAADHAGIAVLTQPKGGTAKALNLALGDARGGLIARLDADDEFTNDYLVDMTTFVNTHPDFDIYSPDLLTVASDGSIRRLYGWPDTRSIGLGDMLERSWIPGAATMARRRVFEATGGYREHIFSEDYDLWLRALALGMRHIYVPEPLYIYHQEEPTRKSADIVSTYRSVIVIQEDLLTSNVLSGKQSETVRSSIAYLESLISEAERGGAHTRQRVATRSVDFLRRAVGRLFGPARADRIVARILQVGRPLRPLWRLWVGIGVRLKHRPRPGQPRRR